MKRIITYFLAALLILAPVESFARTRLLTSAPVYKGTITGLRISAVDGTAFIDNLPYTYSSDFSAGEDGWTAGRGTVAGNIDDIPVTDDNWLRFTVNTESGAHSAVKSISFVAGRTYTISFNYYIPSGQTVVAGIVPSNSSGLTIGARGLTLDAITTYTILYTPQTTNTELKIYATNAAGTSNIQDAGGDDVFYIKDITISEITPYIDGNHQIEIYDASNRMLRGVLKEVGTSEGLDSNIFAGFDFTNWETEANSAIVDADTYSSSAAAAAIRQGGIFTSYTLYKSSVTGSTTSGIVTLIDFGSAANIYATMGGGDKYWTNIGTSSSAKLRNGAIATTDISTLVSQKVIAPSSSGATIVSAKQGETYNWSYKNSAFTYNAASYYVIIRPIR